MAFDKSEKRRRLRDSHDGSKGQWIAMSVMTIGDSADSMAENLDRRFRNMFVIVGRTSLAEILQVPWHLLTSHNIQPGANTGQLTKQNKRCIGTRAAPTKYRGIGFRRLISDFLR